MSNTPDPQVQHKVHLLGVQKVETFIRTCEKNPKQPKLTKGEKAVLRRCAPALFLQGFLWTIDNIALRDDPRVAELEAKLAEYEGDKTEETE